MIFKRNAKVAQFIQDLSWSDLPELVKKQVKWCVLDLLGSIIAGSLTKVYRVVARQAVENWPGDAATILLFSTKASLLGAVMANAFAANALDIDDGYRAIKGHPGAVVFPAVLAAAENRNVSGKEFLTALVVAYEVAIRAGIAWHDHHTEYYGSGSWGSVGAAAGVAKILGLKKNEIVNALGIAEYHAPIMPMMRCIDYPAMTKDGIGWGSKVGMASALLARGGFTGTPSLLGLKEYNHLIETLGRDYEILNLYFKPHACCRWAQPAIDAVLKLRKLYNLNPKDIDRIVVHTFENATKLWLKKPTNTEEAQYNMAFPIAAALVDGEVGPNQVVDENLNRSDIADLVGKVETTLDINYELEFPQKCQCRVELTLSDGTKIDSGTSSAKGDPEAPMGEEEMLNKFRWLAGHVIDSKKVDSIVNIILELDQERTIQPLVGMLYTV